jgi:hypothetical protein
VPAGEDEPILVAGGRAEQLEHRLLRRFRRKEEVQLAVQDQRRLLDPADVVDDVYLREGMLEAEAAT